MSIAWPLSYLTTRNVVDAALYDDQWYIRKLETSLSHNGEFRQFFTSTKVQRAQLMRMAQGIPGAVIPVESYTDILASCLDQAKTIDQSIQLRNRTRTANAADRTGRGTPMSSPRGGQEEAEEEAKEEEVMEEVVEEELLLLVLMIIGLLMTSMPA